MISEKRKLYNKKYYSSAKGKSAVKKYHQSEKGKLAKARADKKYREKIGYNPSESRKAYKRYHEMMRYADKNNAIPIWADKNEIIKIYENCPEGYQVDHIIPIKGKNICGLHVPSNLQYLTVSENCRKNNKWVN